ncbi:hypothetical protein [Chryseobacterium indoltheticum]|uniref:hypothetical protein n=1 Tax=Chryseobacterium indoltheticum TaxID=254 RepID=UPI003F493ECB
MAIDFSKLITIDKSWIAQDLNHHYTEKINDKLNVRVYSIKPSGTTINSISLANSLLDILPYYFKSKLEIDRIIKREVSKTVNAFTTASEIDHQLEVSKKIHTRTYREAKSFFKKKVLNQKVENMANYFCLDLLNQF